MVSKEEKDLIDNLSLNSEPSEKWFEVAIDLSQVSAILESSPDEKSNTQQVTLYVNNDSLVVAGEYYHILNMWLALKVRWRK